MVGHLVYFFNDFINYFVHDFKPIFHSDPPYVQVPVIAWFMKEARKQTLDFLFTALHVKEPDLHIRVLSQMSIEVRLVYM